MSDPNQYVETPRDFGSSHDPKNNRKAGTGATDNQRNVLPRLIRLLKAAGWLAVVGTALALFADWNWLADMVCNFKVQYVLLSIPAAIVYALGKCWKITALLCFGIVYNLAGILPYFVNVPQPRARNEVERLMSFNLLRTNTDYQATIDQIISEDPDFIFLMEVHSGWKTQFEKLKSSYPHQKIVSHQGYTGVAFLSKREWQAVEVFDSGVISNPSIDVTFAANPNLSKSLPLRIIATHPVPPFGAALTQSREKQLIAIAKRISSNNELSETPRGNLVIGDFNLTPWSPSFSRILAAGELSDATLGFGITPTLAPLPTWMGGLKVDHILKNELIATSDFRVKANSGSDHHMLIFDFSVNQF